MDIKIEGELKDLLTDMEDNEELNFYIIEEGVWVSEGKYEYADVIFKYNDKLYCWGQSRSGSYFSEREYQKDGTATEVEEVQVTTTQYRNVK